MTSQPKKKDDSRPTPKDPVEDSLNNAFETMEVSVSAMNTTSKFELPANSIKMVELGDKALVLEGLRTSCAQGHHLMLRFGVTLPGGERVEFVTTARVEGMEQIEGNAYRIDVSMVQYEEEEWVKFQKCFDSRQDEIEQFMKAARGY